MRILVVEDETALRESLAAQLKSAGFTVDTAADEYQKRKATKSEMEPHIQNGSVLPK